MFSQRPWNKKIIIKLNNILNFSRKSDCQAVEPLLWGYAVSQLNSDESVKVTAHIARCSTCRQHLETYRQTVMGVTALRERQVPDSLTTWHTLQARLASETVAKPKLASVNSISHSALNQEVHKLLPTGFTLRSSVLLRLGSCGALAAACLLLGIMTTWHHRANNPRVESASAGLSNVENKSDRHGGEKVRQIASHLATPLESLRSLPHNNGSAQARYQGADGNGRHLDRQHSKILNKIFIAKRMNKNYVILSSSNFRSHLMRNFIKDHTSGKNFFTRQSLKEKAATQIAASTKKPRWTIGAAGMETGTETEQGQDLTEFVLTSVEDSRNTRPDYVMDSVDSDAQNTALQSNNKPLKIDVNKQTDKEMQGW